LRVDLQIIKNGIIVAGIQVKPSSYDNIRPEVKYFNKTANSKYSAPVYYISYKVSPRRTVCLQLVILRLY